jgi:hypothetical protein
MRIQHLPHDRTGMVARPSSGSRTTVSAGNGRGAAAADPKRNDPIAIVHLLVPTLAVGSKSFSTPERRRMPAAVGRFDRVRRLGVSMQDAAQAAGLSVRTGYRCLARDRSEGSEGLRARSSRARTRSRRTAAPAAADSGTDRRPRGHAALDGGGRAEAAWARAALAADARAGRRSPRTSAPRRAAAPGRRLAYVETLARERTETSTAFLRSAVRRFRRQGIRTSG